MTWTRLSDTRADDPRWLMCSRSARLLDIEALVYCNRHLTDGLLPAAALPRITDSADLGKDVAELAHAGLWTARADRPDCWQLNWDDQESAENVLARRSVVAEKQRRYRLRKAAHDAGDHSHCSSRYCPSLRGNATGNATGLVTDSRPVPPRPGGTGKGTGAARADGAGAPPLDGDRWRTVNTWGGATALAHPHAPGSDGRCTFTWHPEGSVPHVCDEKTKAPEHDHVFEAIKDPSRVPASVPRTWLPPDATSLPSDTPRSHYPCIVCGHPRPHPVHADRLKSDTQ